MAKKGKQNPKCPVVSIRCVAIPDATERLSRSLDILLKAAGRRAAPFEENTNTKKEEPPCQAPAEDALTGGGEDSDRQGS